MFSEDRVHQSGGTRRDGDSFYFVSILQIQCSMTFKESDRLCKVVELSMQYYGKLLSDSFETY